MSQAAKGKALGDALLSFLNALSQISTLGGGLAGGGAVWSRYAGNEAILYPSNPLTDLPSLRLRMYLDDVGPGKATGTSQADWTGSLWYKRRQIPSESPGHQENLIFDLETILNTLMGAWRPDQLVNVAGQTLYGVYPQHPVVHDELHHEFDDPRLRVSVGEVPFRMDVKAWS